MFNQEVVFKEATSWGFGSAGSDHRRTDDDAREAAGDKPFGPKDVQRAQRRNNAESTKIFDEFTRLIVKDGATEESVYAELCERFNCTNRRINNARNTHIKNLSPKAQVVSEASLLVAVGKMVGGHDLLQMAYEQELERVQLSGNEWVDMNQSKIDGDKSSTTTKRIPAKRYVIQLEEKIAGIPERALSHISKLLTKNIINVNTGGDLSQQSFTDLDNQEKLSMERLKVIKEAEVVES